MKAVLPRDPAERVLPPTAMHAVYSVFLDFASRTELLHADEIMYVQLSTVCVSSILGRFKIVEYVQYLITCREQRVLQRSHITQVTYFFVLFTAVAETLVTLVIVVCNDPSACRTAPLPFTYRFLLRGELLVVHETRAASEIPVTFGADLANIRERAWRASHVVAKRLIAGVRDIAFTRFVARFTHTYRPGMAAVRFVIT